MNELFKIPVIIILVKLWNNAKSEAFSANFINEGFVRSHV